MAPRPPLLVTDRPGASRSASATVSIWRSRRSAAVMTVTLSAARVSGKSTCDADTTIDSLTALTRRRRLASVRPVPATLTASGSA
jgi:hypothetical protein